MTQHTILLTAIAMVAFAANSLLARQALDNTAIDAATFTLVRLGSGAAALWLFVWLRKVGQRQSIPTQLRQGNGNWWSAAALFVYAAAFSYAYQELTAATGALLLFACVQAVMLFYGYYQGDRLSLRQMLGLLISGLGLVTLLAPSVAAPTLLGTLLMSAAGIGWAIYSLRAGTADPAQTSAENFARSVPIALVLVVCSYQQLTWDLAGFGYGIASGALASGAGYIIWYQVLGFLSTTFAAAVQLSVPAIAAVLGVVLLNESLNPQLLLACCAILGGLAMVLLSKRPSLKDAR